MKDVKKLAEIQEEIANLICQNKFYFKNTANEIIDWFMSDKTIYYKNTPPAWLGSAIKDLLEEYERVFSNE